MQNESHFTTPSNKLDFSTLMKLDLARVKVSEKKIYFDKHKLRNKQEDALNNAITRFNTMLKYKELPDDESFAHVISCLRRCNQSKEAIYLFDSVRKIVKQIVKQKINLKIEKEVMGAYTYSAILEVFRDQLKKVSGLPDQIDDLVKKAEQLWEECKAAHLIDSYLLTDMMCIYADSKKHSKTITLFLEAK